jgi:flagellar biogenesis protein FliO
MFNPKNAAKSPRHQQIWARYEIFYTIIDFSAALLFVVGSIYFFFPDASTEASWCFLFGSLFFAMKPTIRLIRELQFFFIDKERHQPKAPSRQ